MLAIVKSRSVIATREPGGKLTALVLDLRNNPGGLLDQAVAVSSDFINQGEIVSTRARHPEDSQRWDAKGYGVYAAAKQAIRLLSRTAAHEWAMDNIRVNTVAPGPTRTERFDESDDRIALLLGRIPSRRMSTIAEIAAAVVFLASDDAANIHGATLSADGGFAAV